MLSGDTVSSLCVPPVLFDRALSQPVLSDLGILVAAGVHFDVSGPVLYLGGDSVRAGPHLLVASDNGHAPADRWVCVLRLAAIRDAGGGGLWLLQSACDHAPYVVLSHGGWVTCIWIVYTRQGSVEVLQVTGSLLLRILLWCLAIVFSLVQ